MMSKPALKLATTMTHAIVNPLRLDRMNSVGIPSRQTSHDGLRSYLVISFSFIPALLYNSEYLLMVSELSGGV